MLSGTSFTEGSAKHHMKIKKKMKPNLLLDHEKNEYQIGAIYSNLWR